MSSSPVKCQTSVTKISFSLHFFGFLWYCNGIYHDRTVVLLPQYSRFGGRFQYLTLLTAYAIFITTAFATIVDLIQLLTNALEKRQPDETGFREKTSFLLNIRDELVTFWCYAAGTIVVIMYWSIAAIDVDGIHPVENRILNPLFGWYNQYLHTVPLLYVNILIIFVNYSYPTVQKASFYSIIAGAGYIRWMFKCYAENGVWPYRFLGTFSTVQYFVFVVFVNIVLMIAFLCGRWLASKIWNEERKKKVLNNYKNKDH